LAASLVGLIFYLLFRFVSSEKEEFLATLYMTVNTSDVIPGLVLGAIAILWALFLNFAFNALFDSVYGNIFQNKAIYQGINLVLAILSAGFVRPVGEELLFRQFFLKHNLNQFGEMAGLIINGLLFGMRTVDPFFFFVNFGIGILFAYGAKKYSLKTAIFSNIFYNISIIVIIIMFGGK
jgi:membrane protease YdiL (CAAX protease family)